MSFYIELITPPAVEPVTVAELAQQANITRDLTLTDADTLAYVALLQGKIASARSTLEKHTSRSFINQTLDVWFDRQDGVGYFKLPRGRVQSITQFAVYDDIGTETILGSEFYYLSQSELFTHSLIPYHRHTGHGIRIRIVSGYGPAASDVPGDIRDAVKELAAHYERARLGESPEAKYQAQARRSGLPPGVHDKIDRYRIRYI